ncbi:MAG: hypothetical protein U1F57_09820 [bacterium]
MAPPVKGATDVAKADSGKNLQTRARDAVNAGLVLGDKFNAYNEPANRAQYLSLSSLIVTVQDFLSGTKTYDQLKAKITAWAASANYGDPVNQTARANLIRLLSGISDPEMKEKAQSALNAVKASTKEVSSPAAPPPAASPKADVKPAAAPSPAAPANKIVTIDFKTYKEARDERDAKLSDGALGWTAEKKKQYPLAAFAIMKVRDYVAGNETDHNYVRRCLIDWRKDPNFSSDPVLSGAYQKLVSALGTLKVEYNSQRAPKMVGVMGEVDGLGGSKKPDAAPKVESKPPAPAPKAELLGDAAIFGDMLSGWNDPAVKSGRCLPLQTAIIATRDFMDGKIKYDALKQKLSSWEKSPCYSEAYSYRARTNIISILKGVKDGPLADKAKSALMAYQSTKAIEEPKKPAEPPKPPVVPPSPAPSPASGPVAVAEFAVVPVAKVTGAGGVTEDAFRASRVQIAQREHSKSMAKTGKNYNFNADIYVSVDSASGEITKVTFKNVAAAKAGEKGDQPTQAEITELMNNIANAYRAEVKFGNIGKKQIGFKLELKAGAAAAPVPPAPPPPPPSPSPIPPAPPVPPAPPAPKDPVKGSYAFSYSSGHPTDKSRFVGPDNASTVLKGQIGPSRSIYERKLKMDEGLTLKATMLIETDPKTGYVTKVSFSNISYTGSMTSAMAEEIMKRYADTIHAETRWKEEIPSAKTNVNWKS